MRRLLRNGLLVNEITNDAEGEDGYSEGIAADAGAPAEDVCEELVVVLCNGYCRLAWTSV